MDNTKDFPAELMPFVAQDPAVAHVYFSMRHGMTRDQALLALAIHQTTKCAELLKIASDATARHAQPKIIVSRDEGAEIRRWNADARRHIEEADRLDAGAPLVTPL